MRKFSYLLLLGALFVGVSCMDLGEIYGRLDALETQVKDLQELNSTVSGINTVVGQLQNNVYVQSVTETSEGYVIKFTDGKTATITNGAPGKDGVSPAAPTVGVKEVDGELVWTVNDAVVKDESGASVPATVKVPEFKFENNKWWYRFGATDSWKDCGEKTGPEPSITETDDMVIITIGDKSVQIPKEVISPAIEAISLNLTAKAPRIFVPVGQTVDLKDYFEIEPEGALKTMVEYSYTDGAPFDLDDKGVLKATGAGSYTVTIAAKVNPDIKTSVVVRTCETPDNTVPATSVNPDQKIKIYEGSLEEYNQQIDCGGTTSFNPFNGAIAGLFNGTLNFRIGMPVVENTNITMDNGRLHFMFYVSDVSVFTPKAPEDANFLEHTSSGTYDREEIDYDMRDLVATLKSGWNEVDLPLKAFTAAGGDGQYVPSKASFIRFLCNANTNGAWVLRLDDILADALELGPLRNRDFDLSEETMQRLNALTPAGVPVEGTIDLKDFYTTEPEAAKAQVTFTAADGAPFTVSQDGILTVTGAGVASVTVASKANPDVKLSINIHTAECPNAEVPASELKPEQKVKIFDGSLEEYNAFTQSGGTTAWSPAFNAHAAVANGGNINFRFGLPVVANSNLTMENAHLHFMFYVSDPSTLQSAGYDGVHFLEVTSSGIYDKQEVNFELPLFVPSLKSGWNEVDLPFSSANNPNNTDGEFDVTKVNFIRFICPVSSDGKYIAFMVKDLYAYEAEPAGPVKITIDGDMSDWAKVKGVVNESGSAKYVEFKMASDADNIYFYTKRVANSALWNAGGYLYYALDYDNNTATGDGNIWGNGPYECIFVIWPYAGTGDAPAFADKPLGDSMMKPSGSLANYNANGKADDSGVELEFSIPRADFPTIPDSEISVYAWGNKSGEDMKNFPLKIKL